jgi:hypothetical protein
VASEPPVRYRMNRTLFSFDEGYRPEDRWLRFALRASFVLFVISLQAVVVVAVAMFLLVLR